MTAPTCPRATGLPPWTQWNPPPDPARDLWWAAQRIAAPDSDDHTARHQRGVVRLPYDLGDAGAVGDLVPAWVCCDPACGGVELNSYVLEINHACCVPRRYVSDLPYAPALFAVGGAR